MIKTFIILVLVVLLAGGAALTRPSEADFKNWYRAQNKVKDPGLVDALFQDSRINDYLEHLTYKNRVIWTDVSKDGQTVYTGVFGHWINRAKVAKAIPTPT